MREVGDQPTAAFSGGPEEPDGRLWRLWQAGRRPNLRDFLATAGEMAPPRLAAVVRVDQRQRWRAGERVPAEDYLRDFLALAADPEAALDVVYGEFLLREERGESPAVEEYLARFPHLAALFDAQVRLHSALRADVPPPTRAMASPPEGAEFTLSLFSQPVLLADGDRPAIAGYEILRELGRGGMGVVYKARQIRLNRVVALKVMRGAAEARPQDLTRFLLEAEALAAVQHPHVVEVYECGPHNGRPYLAMEYLPGGTLADRLKDAGPLPSREAAILLAKVARGVQAAHDQQIVHRDLKPGNVLFDAIGEPKVTDFGLAKRGAGADLTRTQAVMGTPGYMAPEQAEGRGKFVGSAADVYALGVVLYHCLTGTVPFADDDPLVVLRRVTAEEPEPPRRHRPEVPRDLELICLKCLAKEPAERYATAAALADDLSRFAAGEPVSVRPSGAVERAAKWARRKPTLAATYALALLAVALTGLTLGAVGLWQRAEGDRHDAELARDQLVGEQQQTEAARREAEAARDREVAARRETEAAREDLARLEYARTIDLAHREYRENHIARARQLLDSCRADLRNWEWRYVHRLCHAELLTLRGHNGRVSALAFSPDGAQIVTGGTDGAAKVWNLRTGSVSRTLPRLAGGIAALAFSPDGALLAAGRADGTVKVWDARTGGERLTLKPATRGGGTVSFSPDGAWLVSTDGDLATIWDVRTGARRLAIKHTTSVSCAAFSPDGMRVVTACWGRTPAVAVWDARTGAQQFTLRYAVTARSVAFSPDGTRLVTGLMVEGMARVWDVRTGAPVQILLHGNKQTVTAAFSPDGARILTGGDDGTAKVWDARYGEERFSLKGHSGGVVAVAFGPDGTLAATGSEDGTAKVWDVREGTESLPLYRHDRGWVEAASFGPGGKRVVTAGWDQTARVWDAATGEQRTIFRGHTGSVHSACFSPDGRQILTGSEDGTAKVWDARGGPARLTLRGHGGGVVAAFSPDGGRVLTASRDGTAKVWDAHSGEERFTLRGHTGAVRAAVFDPDGARLATAGEDGTVRVWDGHMGAPSLTFRAHFTLVMAVAFSPDGGQLVTGGWDGTVRVWDARTGKSLRLLRGYAGPVASAMFSPNGERILTGGRDGTAKLWDARTGAELLTLRGHRQDAKAAFGPDGARVVTVGGFELVAKVWDSRPVAGLSAHPAPDWHYREALRCLTWGDRYAAAFHYSRLLDSRPSAGFLAARASVLAPVAATSPAVRVAHARACLAAGDVAGYRAACAALPAEPATLATFWLADGARPDLSKVLAMVAADLLLSGRPGGLRDLGGLLLRAGRPAEAVVCLRLALLYRWGRLDAPHEELLLALAYHRLHQPAESRRWLGRADAWLDRHRLAVRLSTLLASQTPMEAVRVLTRPGAAPPDPRSLVLGWQTWAEVQVLRREAAAALVAVPLRPVKD